MGKGPGAAEVGGGRGEAAAGAMAASGPAVARAWLVHLVTASGAVLALLALLAITRGEWRAALLWMALAMAVDSADGTLARWAHVKRVLPEFDGALLDNVIDYLNYTVVPAFFLIHAPLLPPGWSMFAGGAVALASAYQFCRADAKTDDHFFTGFPSYWNVVVFYLLLLELNPWAALAIVLMLCVLVFVPFRYIYPSRTRPFRPLTLTLASLWGLACLVELLRFPAHSTTVLRVSLLFIVYYVVASALAQRRLRAAGA
jgi:phosphatidylcholine synthase